MKSFLLLLIIFFLFSMIFGQIKKDETAMIHEMENALKKDPANKEILLKLGVLYHNTGLKGDKEAVHKGEEVLKRLIKIDPNNAEAHCWLGSILTLKGRDATFPIKKIIHVKEGLKEMDRAVSLSPENINLRIVRGKKALGLPDIFNRIDIAIEDFEFVLSLKERKKIKLPDTLIRELLMDLGEAYKKKGDISEAKERWERVIELYPDSDEANRARKLINDLKK